MSLITRSSDSLALLIVAVENNEITGEGGYSTDRTIENLFKAKNCLSRKNVSKVIKILTNTGKRWNQLTLFQIVFLEK